MKNRIAAIVSIALITIMAMMAGWIGLIRLTTPSIQANWTRGLYDRKIAAAHQIDGPRIFLIGGSGTHYGYSGADITRLTGLQTINFGIHAGLGMPYLLYRAKKVLRSGDFAVLIIEVPLNFSTTPTTVLSEFVLRYDLRYLLDVSLKDDLSLLFGYTPLDFIAGWARSRIPWTAEIGRPETVGTNGDETLEVSHIQTPADRSNLLNAGPMPTWPVDPNQPPPPLQDFFSWATKHNVRFGIAWTPLLEKSDYKTLKYENFYHDIENWYKINGGVVLGNHDEYNQPPENMFDFIMHANEKGRKAASQVLARHLSEVLTVQ